MDCIILFIIFYFGPSLQYTVLCVSFHGCELCGEFLTYLYVTEYI